MSKFSNILATTNTNTSCNLNQIKLNSYLSLAWNSSDIIEGVLSLCLSLPTNKCSNLAGGLATNILYTSPVTLHFFLVGNNLLSEKISFYSATYIDFWFKMEEDICHLQQKMTFVRR